MGGYQVTAGYVTVQTSVGAGRAYIDVLRGAVLPADVDDETIAVLLQSGAIVADSVDDPDAVPAGAAAAVLAWVGDDKTRAEQALAAEQTRDGGPRVGVVGPLTKLVQA